MKRSLPFSVLCGLFLLLAMGCANPADDAPDATVSEPAPEPAPEQTVATTDYALSADSSIGFVGAKVTGSHDGGFNSFEGKVSVAGGAAAGSSVEVVIDTTSLWSDNDNLTNHLKSADFFDVETYPTATFKSTAIDANDDGSHTVTGNLELHGVTKQISFPAEIVVSDLGFTALAEFSINRMDFDIKYAGKPDDLIRDEVLIKLDLRSGGDEAAAPADAGGEADAS